MNATTLRPPLLVWTTPDGSTVRMLQAGIVSPPRRPFTFRR